MDRPIELVVFALDGQRYALKLAAVERVLRAAEITPLPKLPDIVLGVLNVAGEILPVLDIRRRFHLPSRETDPADHLILARTARRRVALVVDRVSGVVERPEAEVIPAEDVLPGLEYVSGAAKLADGLVLIHDLDTFLSLEEEARLSEALEARAQAHRGQGAGEPGE